MLKSIMFILILTLVHTLCIAQEKTRALNTTKIKTNKNTDTTITRLETIYKTNKDSIPKNNTEDISLRKSLEISIKNEDLKFIPKDIILVDENKIIINLNKTETTLQKITKKIKEEGHVFFEVTLGKIKTENSKFKCLLNISFNESEKRRVNKIILKGYKKFPRKFISKHLKIKEGEIIDITNLENKTLKLKTLEFAEIRKMPEILFKKDSSIVYLYIDKKNRNSFDGVIGFNSDEEDGKLEFTGYLNLNLLNNFNTGENIRLNYRSDENRQRFIRLNIENPLLFNSTLNSNTEVSLFTKDSTFTNTRFSQELNRTISANNTIGIGFLNETSKIINKTEDNSLSNYNTNNLFLTYSYRNSTESKQGNDNLFNIGLKNSFGKKKTIGKKISRVNIEFEIDKTIALNKRNHILVKNINKKVIGQDITQNELYRFGGINSIRGFDENSIEADTFSVINLEYAYKINNSLSFNTVTDFGYFENTILKQKEKLLSLGIGLSTITKSGLLNLIIATGKSENEPLKFSNTKIHLSLKTFF